MKLVVDRKKWLRGANGVLWNSAKNCGCILGHYALACGWDPRDLDGVQEPSELAEVAAETGLELEGVAEWREVYARGEDYEELSQNWHQTRKADLIMEINDTFLADEAREPALVKQFADIGVELSFEG